jgi:hypothetical protein
MCFVEGDRSMTNRIVPFETRLPVLRAGPVICALLLAACSPASQSTGFTGGSDFGAGMRTLVADNGLGANGLNMNGLNMNGLNMNGLNMNGLSTTAFKTWFNQSPVTASAVMKYLYACAAPAGAFLTWTNPTTGMTYTWAGLFGLATDWTGGAAPTVAEQQVITACLAAHVNKFGVHVPIALEGRSATGAQILMLPGELTTYSVREACFFGNLFSGEGVYAGIDHSIWANPQSSARACAFDNTSASAPVVGCPPMVYAGSCKDFCTPDKSKTFYESCTWNGKIYKPLVTRLLPSEIFQCGDGVCQFTEMCGTRAEWWQCKDCGPCP